MSPQVLKVIANVLAAAAVLINAYLTGRFDPVAIVAALATAGLTFGAGAVTIKRVEDATPKQVAAKVDAAVKQASLVPPGPEAP